MYDVVFSTTTTSITYTHTHIYTYIYVCMYACIYMYLHKEKREGEGGSQRECLGFPSFSFSLPFFLSGRSALSARFPFSFEGKGRDRALMGYSAWRLVCWFRGEVNVSAMLRGRALRFFGMEGLKERGLGCAATSGVHDAWRHDHVQKKLFFFFFP
jgi:hypothetical protein